MDFMNFRILDGFKRPMIFEVSCLLFEISGQRFAKFAVDLNEAIRQLGKASLECFCNVLVLAHVLTPSHVSDELFDDGRRVLIVFRMSHVGVILRLNEGIGRQLTALAVSLKLPIEVKMIGQKKQLQQRMSLRDVVEIDLPVSDARLLEAVIYCLNIG